MNEEDTQLDISQYKSLGELMSTIGGVNRVQAFLLLSEGMPPKEIAEVIDISRSGLQNYINDYKSQNLVKKDGKSLVPTETGEWLHDKIIEMEDEYKEYRQSELRAQIEELGVYASDSTDEFIKKLIRDHPDEARAVLDEENSSNPE